MNWLLSLEIISTITGITCVWLQTKEKILAWPFGIVSVALAAIIFGYNKLYSDLILHVVFLFLNIYGWIIWSRISPSDINRPVEYLTNTSKIIYLGVIGISSYLWGWIMASTTDADLPYFDSFTTVGSLIAQYLLSRKVLFNWLLWIMVDVVAVNVYLYKGLYFFGALFAVYLILCIKGYISWKSTSEETMYRDDKND